MSSPSCLFFVALVPPITIQEEVTAIQQDFAHRFNSRHALKSPPHITLQSPFKLVPDQETVLKTGLSEFAIAHYPFHIALSGFGAFGHRVIYINVIKNSELLNLNSQLTDHLKHSLNILDKPDYKTSFHPHITVAFKDLTRQNFRQAWQEFQHRSIEYEFTAQALTLLRHNGHHWEINQQFPWGNH